jgi:prepilin-type N-terminal cleavage/methylation domain-containing protein
MPRPVRDAGFTLVEVLVALVVVSLLLGVTMNAATEAAARRKHAESQRAAILLAASLLEEAAASNRPVPRTGRSGALLWQLDYTVQTKDPRGIFALTEVDATVHDLAGKILFRAGRSQVVVLDRS